MIIMVFLITIDINKLKYINIDKDYLLLTTL